MTRISLLLMMLAALACAHTVHLDDGSLLVGEVLLLNEQSLILSTDFAGTLTLERAHVAAIILDDDFTLPSIGIAAVQASGQVPSKPVVEGSGILELLIEGDPAKSSVRFHKESEREAMIALNTLHLRVFMDGQEVAHVMDDEMDKEFRQGKWLVVRNSHRFEPLRIELPAGKHRLQIVVSNNVGAALKAGNQEILSAEVIVDDVHIIPDQLTRVIVKGKAGKLGSYGKYKLELLSSR